MGHDIAITVAKLLTCTIGESTNKVREHMFYNWCKLSVCQFSVGDCIYCTVNS